MLVLLSLMAASFARTTRIEINLTRNLIENAKAEALADAGLYRAVLALLEPNANKQWRADGRAYRFDIHDGVVWISIQDEGGKIDLNGGRDQHLRGLFLLLGVEADVAAALVDAIVDFRDEDDLHRLQGAEDDDYRDAGLPWGAKDRPFEAVEELRRVLGMTPELYDRISPYLTVYTGQRGVNAAALRAGALAAEDTFDTDVADDNEVDTDQGAAPEAAPVDLERLAGVTGGRRSRRALRIYSVRAEATVDSGALFVREAVVRLTGRAEQPWLVHAWRQGRMDPLAH